MPAHKYKTKRSCEAAGRTWRKGVRGVRKGSCAKKAKKRRRGRRRR